MRDFRKLRIWSEAIELSVQSYQQSRKLPKDERFGLRSQIRRASVSIAANIAEGCSRTSEKEYKHFLEISVGSAFELETHFVIVQKLELIKANDLIEFLKRLTVLQRSINSLIQKLG